MNQLHHILMLTATLVSFHVFAEVHTTNTETTTRRVFYPRSCNVEIFGTNDPKYLEPNWAQNAVGSGFLKPALLSEEELSHKVTVSVTGESGTTQKFRNVYGSNADWGSKPVTKEDNRDLHTEATMSLVTGPWSKSVGPKNNVLLQTVKYKNGEPLSFGDISTNQSAGCWEQTKAHKNTAFFGSAGNDWTRAKFREDDFYDDNCIYVTSVDPLGFASDFTSYSGKKSATIAAYSDSLQQVMDGEEFGGTSGASPATAGAAIFVAKANPKLSASEIISVLRVTATEPRKDGSHQERLGSGLVNIPRAVALARALKDRSIKDINGLDVGSIDKMIPLNNPKFHTFDNLRKKSDSCEDYLQNIRVVMRAAMLFPAAPSKAKSILADFYFFHGLSISAHRTLKTPISDPKLHSELRRILDDKEASTSLKAFAISSLTRAKKISSKELRDHIYKNSPPGLILAAAKSLAFQGLLTKKDCDRVNEVGNKIAYENATHMEVASWGSEINEPVAAECRKFGKTWRY